MESNEKQTRVRNNARPNFRSKSNKWWKKKLNSSWNHWLHCRTNCAALVIIQVSKESKLMIHSNLRRPRFSFTHSFKFIYKCFVKLLRKIGNHWKLLKLQQNTGTQKWKKFWGGGCELWNIAGHHGSPRKKIFHFKSSKTTRKRNICRG